MLLLASTLSLLSLPVAQASTPKFETYLDAPFVQASFVTGAGTLTETFDSLTASASGTQCDGNTWAIGTVSNPTAGVDCRVFPNNDDLGAMTSSSSPTVNIASTSGIGTNFVTTNPGSGYSVTFSGPQKYIGFWWSAGSSGNRVNFKSNGQIVAYMDVGTTSTATSLMGKFGNAPICTSSATYLGKTDAITAEDGTIYPTRRYFGNPIGYTSVTPSICSSKVPDQPFVYIHAFATEGATFDSVEFSGANFEIDNVTISNVSQTPLSRLVLLERTNASALTFAVTYDQRGGSGATGGSDTFTVGSPLFLKSAPTKAGYTFNGWYTQAVGGSLAGAAGSSYDPGATSNITLYARWGAATTTTITLNSADLSPGGSLVEGANQRVQSISRDAVDNSLLPATAGTIDFVYVDGLGTIFSISNCSGVAISSGIANCTFVIPPGNSPYIIYATFQTSDAMTYTASANNTGAVSLVHTAKFLSNSGHFSDSSTVQSNPYVAIGTPLASIQPTPPEKLYYRFLGWSTDSSTVLADTYAINVSETFTAIWSPKVVAVFDANGGFFSDSSTVQVSAEYPPDSKLISTIKPSNPSKSGYTFMGWSSDGVNVFSDHLLHNLEYIKAVFIPNFTYTNNFYANGGFFSDSSTIQSSVITQPHILLSAIFPYDPTFGRKIFLGWSSDSSTIAIDSEITGSGNYWALWGADGVYATYLSNGGTFSDATTIQVSSLRTSGTDALTITPSDPVRPGYTFSGWKVHDVSGSTPLTSYPLTTDTTFSAIWTPVSSVGSSGSGSSSSSGSSARSLNVPGVNWQPSNLNEGEAIGDQQLNAKFSTNGTAKYSVERGEKPGPGFLAITVTFTPEDKINFMVLSTTRTIQIKEKAKPSLDPKPDTSSTPMPTVTKTSTPTPTPTPSQSQYAVPKTLKVSELKKLGVIYFNSNEYFLDHSDRKILNVISSEIKSENYKTVIIQGNTDIKLGVDNNWLSKARAEAVSKYLTNLSSAPFYNRVWYASRRPATIGIDKKSLALNRRVEIYAQVTVEKPSTNQSIQPKTSISKSFDSITFNRNESFLDASDRKSLLNIVRVMAKSGCTQVFLKGSHDRTKSAINEHIGNNRANAVRKFMAGLLPSLTFRMEPEFVSAERVVEIRCTN